LEGRLLQDHVHILISIPPKYAVSQVVGYIKGKSAIYRARNDLGKRRDFKGQHFWARGYYVSTVGIDEDVIREYIRQQEDEDRRVDQLSLWEYPLNILGKMANVGRICYPTRQRLAKPPYICPDLLRRYLWN